MSFRSTLAVLAAAALLSVPALAQDSHPAGQHSHDVYARSMGGVGASGAVFLLMHNNTETDDRLIGVKSDVAKRVELHTNMMTDDGVMQMTAIEGGIPIPAGATHELARGGDHVMLMGLTRDLQDGDTFALTLVFEVAGEVVVEAVVDNQRKPGKGMMKGQDQSAMDGASGG